MRIISAVLFFGLLISISCNKPGKHEHHHEEGPTDENPNQALYEEVMVIHDEVMPKADEIYELKKELQDKIAKTPDLVADKKKELDQIINELDSADHSMMDWMHKFKYFPEADTVNTEASREYLENEMERIRNVRELINGSIQRAKEEMGKKE